MANSVYRINKGINKPIEFKGLKAQYIGYLAAGVITLLILFAILYIAGVNTYLCLALVLTAGSGLITWTYALSNRYGEHGMMKKMARSSLPSCIKAHSRKPFISLLSAPNGNTTR